MTMTSQKNTNNSNKATHETGSEAMLRWFLSLCFGDMIKAVRPLVCLLSWDRDRTLFRCCFLFLYGNTKATQGSTYARTTCWACQGFDCRLTYSHFCEGVGWGGSNLPCTYIWMYCTPSLPYSSFTLAQPTFTGPLIDSSLVFQFTPAPNIHSAPSCTQIVQVRWCGLSSSRANMDNLFIFCGVILN